MSGLLEVQDVSVVAETYALEVSGRVLSRDQPVSLVTLSNEGDRLWELPLDGESFSGSFNALRLPPEFAVDVDAVLEDGAATRMATVEGRRSELKSAYEPAIQPLMVTGLGRTGSTAVIKLLGSHPDIATYRPFQYESRAGSYWISILLDLAEPASYLRQLSPGRQPGIDRRGWWLGTRTPPGRPIPDRGVQRWLGEASVEALATFCQSRLDAVYSEVAGETGRGDARYFAEKFMPGPIPSLAWELCPGAREIVLVRDFRDMVCSVFAYNAKRGFEGLGRGDAETDEQYILENVKGAASRLLRGWQRRADRAHLLRYEDLVLRPAETIEKVLEYLGLAADEQTLAAMSEAVSGDLPEATGHRTAPSQQDSIGRWRRDLDPGLQRTCEAALGPALEAFGYALEVPAGG